MMRINPEILEQMIQKLAENQYAVSDQLLPKDFVEKLSLQCQELFTSGSLKKAAIGVGAGKNVHEEIRGDFTRWIEPDSASAEQLDLLASLEQLQNEMNQQLYLGLRRFEIHFAFYPAQSGYQKHIDNPRGQGHRRITFILYLNQNWQPEAGGVLALFDPAHPEKILTRIEPTFGKVVLFCSDVFPHKVETAYAPRKSITGWFRNDAL